MSLPEVIQERMTNPYNAQLVGNLALVADAVQSRPISNHSWYEQRALDGMLRSAHSSATWGGMIQIDRTIEELLNFYALDKEQLKEFASGGTVVDVGCGQSSFLDFFKGLSQTIAVDVHTSHVNFQQGQGHVGLNVAAEKLEGIATGSVRLLHATFSSPYWAVTTREAAAAAHEYRRVLEPGGIALVGPLGNSYDHTHEEQLAGSLRWEGADMLPWEEDDLAPHYAHTRAAFTQALLENGSLLNIIGERYINSNHGVDSHRSNDDIHLPNYLILQRAGVATVFDGSRAPDQA